MLLLPYVYRLCLCYWVCFACFVLWLCLLFFFVFVLLLCVVGVHHVFRFVCFCCMFVFVFWAVSAFIFLFKNDKFYVCCLLCVCVCFLCVALLFVVYVYYLEAHMFCVILFEWFVFCFSILFLFVCFFMCVCFCCSFCIVAALPLSYVVFVSIYVMFNAGHFAHVVRYVFCVFIIYTYRLYFTIIYLRLCIYILICLSGEGGGSRCFRCCICVPRGLYVVVFRWWLYVFVLMVCVFAWVVCVMRRCVVVVVVNHCDIYDWFVLLCLIVLSCIV